MTPSLKTPNIFRTAVLFCPSVQFLPQFPRRKMNRGRQFPPCCLRVTTTEPAFAPNPSQSPDENAIYCNRRPQLSPAHSAEHSLLLQKTQALCVQANPNSLQNTRTCATFHKLCSVLEFVGPLFSWSYELLFPQALWFQNYLRCPRGVGVL